MEKRPRARHILTLMELTPSSQLSSSASNHQPPAETLDVGELVHALGLRIEHRAKCGSGRIFYWTRLVTVAGREIACSGGWYESENSALLRAAARLRVTERPPCVAVDD